MTVSGWWTMGKLDRTPRVVEIKLYYAEAYPKIYLFELGVEVLG